MDMTTQLRACFKHVGIYVHDLPAMANFYTSWFGLVQTDGGVGSSGKGAFFSSDPAEHHQIVMVVGRDPQSKPTINQLSFLVDDLTMLKAYWRKALDEGVKISMVKSHGNALSVYVLDPEGNQCEIYCHTPWYVSQPAGKPLDLSLPDEEILAGVESDARANPSFMSREAWMGKMARQMAA
jgi:catechol 2,3-dioxygenase